MNIKWFLIAVLIYSTGVLCGQNEDFNRYKKIMLKKCQNGNSESCKNMGTLLDVKSDKQKIDEIACAEDISEACYNLAKIKNNNKNIQQESVNLKSETLEQKKLFKPVKGRYGLNPTFSFDHGGGATSLGIGVSAEAFVVDQFSLLARLILGYANSNNVEATSVNFLAGFRLYAIKEASVLPFFQLGGGLLYLHSGGASASAAVIAPGVGVVIPINNTLTANIEVDPSIVFNNGTKFYISTTFGIGFWF